MDREEGLDSGPKGVYILFVALPETQSRDFIEGDSIPMTILFVRGTALALGALASFNDAQLYIVRFEPVSAWGHLPRKPCKLPRTVISDVAVSAQSQLICMSSDWKHSMMKVCEGSIYSMKCGLETKGQ
jgi:hypothetical protein